MSLLQVLDNHNLFLEIVSHLDTPSARNLLAVDFSTTKRLKEQSPTYYKIIRYWRCYLLLGNGHAYVIGHKLQFERVDESTPESLLLPITMGGWGQPEGALMTAHEAAEAAAHLYVTGDWPTHACPHCEKFRMSLKAKRIDYYEYH